MTSLVLEGPKRTITFDNAEIGKKYLCVTSTNGTYTVTITGATVLATITQLGNGAYVHMYLISATATSIVCTASTTLYYQFIEFE